MRAWFSFHFWLLQKSWHQAPGLLGLARLLSCGDDPLNSLVLIFFSLSLGAPMAPGSSSASPLSPRAAGSFPPSCSLGRPLRILHPVHLKPNLKIPKFIHLSMQHWPQCPLDKQHEWPPDGTHDPQCSLLSWWGAQ